MDRAVRSGPPSVLRPQPGPDLRHRSTPRRLNGPGWSGRPRPTDRSAPLRPEDSDDPDAAYARQRLAEIDSDEPDLSGAQFWLLRRGPLIALIAAAALLFVFTAYAGSGGNDGRAVRVATRVAGPGTDMNCVKFVDSQNAYTVSCGDENDGRIVDQVERVVDCPDATRYALVNNGFVCVRGTAGGSP